MVARVVARSGEVFCGACGERLTREDSSCPACNSLIDAEVEAFKCPKCGRQNPVGIPECPSCGLRFVVVAPKQEAAPEEDYLAKLIRWGQVQTEASTTTAAGAPEATGPLAEARVQEVALDQRVEEVVTKRQAQDAKVLREEIARALRSLAEARARVVERLQARLADEQSKLHLYEMDGSPALGKEEVEREVMVLAAEMEELELLQQHIGILASAIDALLKLPDIEAAVRERGLQARAVRERLAQREREVEAFRAKEEELTRREELLDRKIRAYAQKKRELERSERELQEQTKALEAERETLLASHSADDRRAQEALSADRRRVQGRLQRLGEVAGLPPRPQETSAIEDLDAEIAALEARITQLGRERTELDALIAEARTVDGELKTLLPVLDQLLGQLPPEAIEQFAKSEHFTLYEKILNRLGV